MNLAYLVGCALTNVVVTARPTDAGKCLIHNFLCNWPSLLFMSLRHSFYRWLFVISLLTGLRTF